MLRDAVLGGIFREEYFSFTLFFLFFRSFLGFLGYLFLFCFFFLFFFLLGMVFPSSALQTVCFYRRRHFHMVVLNFDQSGGGAHYNDWLCFHTSCSSFFYLCIVKKEERVRWCCLVWSSMRATILGGSFSIDAFLDAKKNLWKIGFVFRNGDVDGGLFGGIDGRGEVHINTTVLFPRSCGEAAF